MGHLLYEQLAQILEVESVRASPCGVAALSAARTGPRLGHLLGHEAAAAVEDLLVRPGPAGLLRCGRLEACLICSEDRNSPTSSPEPLI